MSSISRHAFTLCVDESSSKANIIRCMVDTAAYQGLYQFHYRHAVYSYGRKLLEHNEAHDRGSTSNGNTVLDIPLQSGRMSLPIGFQCALTGRCVILKSIVRMLVGFKIPSAECSINYWLGYQLN